MNDENIVKKPRLRFRKLSVVGASMLLATSTFFSAILGFLREQLIIGKFGYGVEVDAYRAAFKLPDLFYFLVVSGAIGVTFIPIFNRRFYGGNKESAWQITSSLLNILGAITMICSLLILFLAEPIVKHFIIPGADEETIFMAASLMRVVAINPLLFAISSVLSTMQQAMGRFIYYALAPTIYSIGIIFGTIFLTPHLGIIGVAYGVVLGSFMQLLLVAYGVRGTGFKYHAKMFWHNQGLRKIFRLMPARAADQSLDYGNSIVETVAASYLKKSGAIGWYESSLMLYQMPVNLIGMAISTAAFPKLNERIDQKRPDLFKKEVQGIFKIIIWLSIPVAIVTYSSRTHLARLIGKKLQPEVAGLVGILAFLIVFKCLYHLLARVFYAREDTKTPLKISVFTVCSNMLLAILLTQKIGFGVYGLALAQTITGIIEIIIMITILNRRIEKLISFKQMYPSLSKMFVAGTFTLVVSLALSKLFPVTLSDIGFFALVPKLAIITIPTLLTFIASSYLLNIDDVKPYIQKITKYIARPIRFE